MNKEHALKIFKNYTANYDSNNISIRLKIAHTYRVASLSERIARNVLSEQQNCTDFAWLLGLLHDIGRFEQFTRYGTFKDASSIDHAELGADILFQEGLFVRDEVMQYVNEHRCVPRGTQFNELESLISQCCMAFELEYPESRAIVIEQGYLKKLLDQDSEMLTIVKAEIMKAWGE